MGPSWAWGATGIVTLALGSDTYLVEFFEPLDDGSGDGAYVAAPFTRTTLSTDLIPQQVQAI
jgi:hypothetical protein